MTEERGHYQAQFEAEPIEGGYIDARVKLPEDGQKILCYLRFDEAHGEHSDSVPYHAGRFPLFRRVRLLGPTIMTYSALFKDGTYRPLMYWQPCPELVSRQVARTPPESK